MTPHGDRFLSAIWRAVDGKLPLEQKKRLLGSLYAGYFFGSKSESRNLNRLFHLRQMIREEEPDYDFPGLWTGQQ